MKYLLILSFAILANSINAQQCEYKVNEKGLYTCVMSVNNPTGTSTYERITGNHLSLGLPSKLQTNDDVISLKFAPGAKAMTFPTNICKTFRNLENIDAANIDLGTIDINAFVGCKNVFRLQLNNNKISTVNSHAFNSMDNLNELDLGNNQLRTLPSGVFKFQKSFKKLILSNNLFNESIPAELVNGPSLVYFEMVSTSIEALPARLFERVKTIDTFIFENNPQVVLTSDVFYGVEKIGSLSMQSNGIKGLPKNFFNVNNIDVLNLSGNKIQVLDKSAFGNVKINTKLQLQGNPIIAMERALAETLKCQIFFSGTCYNGIIQPGQDPVKILDACIKKFSEVFMEKKK